MATRKEIDGSAGVPQFYGKELRFKREEAGLTLEKLVDGSFYGITYLSEIEHGHRRMPEDLAQHVDRVLSTDGFFGRRCGDVRKAKRGAHAPSFAPVVEAETRARTINHWSNTLFPGLLQTRPYAHAVIRSTHPLDTPEDVEAKIEARMQRARLFDNPKKPEYWAVLHEALVRHPIVSPEEMADQLEHIAALVRRSRIVTQILPWNGPTRPFTELPLFLMDFDDEPPLLYTEGPYHGQTIDDPSLVMQYRKAYDRLRAAALPPEASLHLIEKAAEEYRNGQHRS
ncbi:helix-turn-helix transcriptional regulator [Streptomyces sp. NBC_00053]|uniref:helix-turn-helix domain-containing protein n=1 Tax=unclassified Streptomyces TaxID=2593676 RepID=UPI002259A988|nr:MULTISPECIES: helix-turn-helix transcriptional regulator [unclassified Streptomyces]MCX4396106.1 helix-turn-helix transcriptional regulator [Streptomyces sp. NBC_01767]MCX5501013.1 helix-turn-helix transcriptional regulator [Streptomyces sp. NBC_00052]MCX5550452.1 helix-turn-helix transcriptional regulator [Streptomyces sp. NBC_00051]WSX01989.1 helix-turn-helix transcriptional regulator [Streptomyces sp. NBC_00987]